METGDVARLEIRRGGQKFNEKTFSSVKKFSLPLANREFVGRWIWTNNEDGSVSVAVVTDEVTVDYGGNIGRMLRGTASSLFTARNITSFGGVKQCSIQLKQHFDAGGYMPAYLVNKRVPRALGVIKQIKQSFERDDEIDHATLMDVSRILKDKPQS